MRRSLSPRSSRSRRGCACSRRAARRCACPASTNTRCRRFPCPLPAHDRFEDVVANDAVRLFAARARAVDPSFDADGREPRAASSAVCRRLDGLPLALELAAAWIKVLSPAEIARRLGHALWTCSSRAPAISRPASRRCAQRSTGATTCSTSPSSASACRALRLRRWLDDRRRRGGDRRRRRRAASRHSSTTAWSGGGMTASRCSRRFASTPPSGSHESGRAADATPSARRAVRRRRRGCLCRHPGRWRSGDSRLRPARRGGGEPSGGARVDGRDRECRARGRDSRSRFAGTGSSAVGSAKGSVCSSAWLRRPKGGRQLHAAALASVGLFNCVGASTRRAAEQLETARRALRRVSATRTRRCVASRSSG